MILMLNYGLGVCTIKNLNPLALLVKPIIWSFAINNWSLYNQYLVLTGHSACVLLTQVQLVLVLFSDIVSDFGVNIAIFSVILQYICETTLILF